MTGGNGLRFMLTPAHACSYIEGREASTLFVDPRIRMDAGVYTALSSVGFRRSGSHLYRPHCAACKACLPLRIPVARFTARRRHRRNLLRNQDLRSHYVQARFTDEYYALYARYIAARHNDGDMFPPSREQFASFLLGGWSDTRFLEMRAPHGALLGVAVTDFLSDGLSAIYTFFDPDHARRGLGTWGILRQIQHAAKLGLPYLYLGYWIRESPKMSYKGEFRPCQVFTGDAWQELDA